MVSNVKKDVDRKAYIMYIFFKNLLFIIIVHVSKEVLAGSLLIHIFNKTNIHIIQKVLHILLTIVVAKGINIPIVSVLRDLSPIPSNNFIHIQGF